MPLRKTKIQTGIVCGVPCGNPMFTVFRGIPYAAPVSGENRFRAPQLPKSWGGALICDQFPERAMQKEAPIHTSFGGFFHKEFYPYTWKCGDDCLRLNLWTPAQSIDERLPVMLWIHGGGGYGHEMEFDGEAFCREGVILVTINYRLNCFDYFSHPDLSKENYDGISGNYGILDQIAAMKWVQNNISAFGGDPGNVTIFGQSAGGGSVISHLCTKAAHGLFHKAIVQSGTMDVISHTDGPSYTAAEEWGRKACLEMGKTIDDLRKMPAEEVYDAFEQVSRVIGPAPRKWTDKVIYTKTAKKTVLEGNLKNVPIMVGSVRGDLDLRVPGMSEEDAWYLEGIPDADRPIIGDTVIACKQAEDGRIPAYVYFFDPHIPGHDTFDFVPDGKAYHSSELWYIFGTLNRCWRDFDGRHYELSRKMIKYWTNFAKSGNPNGDGLPMWEPVTGKTENRMYFNEDIVEMRKLKYTDLIRKKFLKQ